MSGSGSSQTYTPDANYNGSDSLTYKVTDRGDPDNCSGSAPACDAAQTSATKTVSITVNSVNDAPAGTDAPTGTDRAANLNEDTLYTVKASDFGFTDPNDEPFPNNFLAVHVTSVPSNGALTYDGNPVAVNDVIPVSGINANKLVFTPDPNEYGANYAQLGFKVQDDGGTALGGQDTDQSANTLTFDVNSVNDAPR